MPLGIRLKSTRPSHGRFYSLVISHGKPGKKIDVRGLYSGHSATCFLAGTDLLAMTRERHRVRKEVRMDGVFGWCGTTAVGLFEPSAAHSAPATQPCRPLRSRPSSLVVNTATRHLVVTGSIPIWVTTPQRRERWGSGFNSRKSPRPGKVWACDGQRFILGFEPVT